MSYEMLAVWRDEFELTAIFGRRSRRRRESLPLAFESDLRMCLMLRFVISSVFTIYLTAATTSVLAESPDIVDFDRDIRPILSNTCYTCHGPDANKRATELRFDVEDNLFGEHDEPVVVRGQPAESALIARITSGDRDYRMPPVDSKQQLLESQIE